MSAVWNAVFGVARTIDATEALRLTNLSIAAAAHHATQVRRSVSWEGENLRKWVTELARSKIDLQAGDNKKWQRLSELAGEAAHLGVSPEGMHSWAAAYQKASSTQKALGAYATHHSFASALAKITMGELDANRVHRVIDPSVGAGNLLLAAIERFGRNSTDTHLKKFILSLHGVELDPRARELCCLLLWLSGARCGVRLDQVASNIRAANALTLDWWREYDLFDALLMNPPWESLRHKMESDPGGARAATIARLEVTAPGAEGLPPLFSAQGSGDRNLFKAFVELAPHLIRRGGRLGALIPAAFASDAGLSDIRDRYFSQFEIARWTSFENRSGYFPIDGRYKFGLLAATRSNVGTKKLWVRSFAIEPDEVDAPHILLGRGDISLIGRGYQIIPELTSQGELRVLRTVLQNGSPFFERGPLGLVRYAREVDLSLDKNTFSHVTSLPVRRQKSWARSAGNVGDYVPLLEGRFVGSYDCFQKSWVSGAGRTAVWADNGERLIADCRPQYVIAPQMDLLGPIPRVAICDITSATNTRTVIATLVPDFWRCGNTAPVLEFESPLFAMAGLGILNSMVFDWMARRLVSGLHLNKFILEGMVWPRFSSAALTKMAFSAWSICQSMPRSGIELIQNSCNWGGKEADPMTALEARVAIECGVAKAFGIGREDLSIIYDDDQSNRRGFWRYFDADPLARDVVRQTLRKFR